jgi:hypothetical protein
MPVTDLLPSQYGIIYKVSFLSIGSAIYAIYNGYYMISLCPGGIFLTSINYWRKPDYSWRRYVDMTYVYLALVYQLYKAYRSQHMMQYYGIMVISISMYPIAIYYHKKQLYWHSAYAHCALHIIANIANIVLYSGRIL